MKKKIILQEQEVLKAIYEFYSEADCETLGEDLGRMYGGKCVPLEEKDGDNDTYTGSIIYEFTPDENYMGHFGELEN